MTRAPSSAHRFAAARPMPLLAPVIQTVLLCQLMPYAASNVDVGVLGVFLDECTTRRNLVAH